MTTTYIVIEENVYLTNTAEEIAEAQAALRDAGLASAPVYVGEPDGLGESYRNGQVLWAGQHTKVEVEVTVDGVEYTAQIDGEKVIISAGGVWAGNGRWNGHQVEDCAADLGDAAYEAIDAAIRNALDAVAER
jgi:hypothetical protein